jgi:CBS domain containing-hemolysin-like protein
MSDPQIVVVQDKREVPERSLVRGVRSWLRALTQGRDEHATRETLAALIAEEAAAVKIDPRERELLLNILHFGELRAGDVMVPRADIVSVPVDISLAELVRVFNDRQHSRLPVFRGALDDVVGFVHVKDVMARWGDAGPFQLKELVRTVLFAPPSMPVTDLLIRMRTTRIHMALVIDEYGGVDGLVTIEDLVEEIVGEIADEYDEAEGPMLVAKPDGSFEADARAPIDEFEAKVGRDLLPDEEDEYIDTLGGLVVSLIGRVPQRGELVAHPSGIEFEVLDADPRRVKRLRAQVKPTAAPTET